MEKELVEFPVIIDDTNEVLTLFLNKETATRANQDQEFLRSIINKYKPNINGSKDALTDCDTELKTNESNSKSFVWPDAAVFLLIELYREKEPEFNAGKRHNVIWAEIAAQMKQNNEKYAVSGLQCSTKFAGLRRTYKNIYEQNKKSGNSHSSWAFYSAMDSLIGEKAYIQPPAEASSEGPAPPMFETSSSGSSSPLPLSENLRSAPKKRRVESILENYINDIKLERENIKEQREEERKKKEAKYEERKNERERVHKDNMEIQKSLLTVLQTLANKK